MLLLRLDYIVTLVDGVDNSGSYQVDLHELPEISKYLKNFEYTFGFIAVNVSGEAWTQTLWSKPIPLGRLSVGRLS